MNRHDRKAMVAEARKLVRKVIPGVPLRQSCLYHAWAICQVGHQHGHRFLLQAGTSYWPCLRPELDDGVSPNRFGYEFDTIVAAGCEAMNMMPEMHVWAGDPYAGEIIDLTTGLWPAQAMALQKIAWKAPKPPDYVWCDPRELPKDVVYRATKEASLLAKRLLESSFGVGCGVRRKA